MKNKHAEYVRLVYNRCKRRKKFDGVPVFVNTGLTWLEGYFHTIENGYVSVYIHDYYGGDYYSYKLKDLRLNPNPVDEFSPETIKEIKKYVKKRVFAKPKEKTREQKRKYVMGDASPEDFHYRIWLDYKSGQNIKRLAERYFMPQKWIKGIINEKKKRLVIKENTEQRKEEFKQILTENSNNL